MIDATTANSFFSILTIAGQGLVITSILLAILFRKNKKKNPLYGFFKEYGIIFAFIVAFGSVTGSLIYSEVLKFEPCTLCWYQRIFMFPQSIIFGMALLKKDRKIIDYGIVLSTIGLLISIYHYFLQFSGATGLPCSADVESGGCSTQLVLEFGYITIPMMGLTSFALILLALIYTKNTNS